MHCSPFFGLININKNIKLIPMFHQIQIVAKSNNLLINIFNYQSLAFFHFTSNSQEIQFPTIKIYIFMHPIIDRSLQKINNTGKYQKLVVVFLFFIAGFVNYLLMGPTYIFMNPMFQCSFSEDLVDQSIACDRIQQCNISNSFTIVAKMNLYCDEQVNRNIIQAINPIGSIFGLFVVNFISDYRGKKFAIIVAQIVAILSILTSVISAYGNSIPGLSISQFLGGFSGYSMIIMAYIYPSEMCEDEFRQKSLIIINYAWSLTSVLLGILYYFQTYWYNYLVLFVLAPMIAILLISFFFLVQGPNFLYAMGKKQESLKSLQTIALYNDTLGQFHQVEIDFRNESNQQQQEKQSISSSLKKIFKDKHYRNTIFILISAEVGAGLYYTATNYALDSIGFDYGANMVSTGIIELFAFMILHFHITKIPKKKGLIVLYSLMAAIGLLFFIQPIQKSKITSFVIIGILRFFGVGAYVLIIMLLTEMFPMKVQAICAGIIESIAQLGNFLGPIIITICINLQIYPIIVLSFVLVFTLVIPLLFLKTVRQKTDPTPSQIEKDQKEVYDSLIVPDQHQT